jgi:hypothetical protein
MTINLLRVEERLKDRICPNCVRFTRERTCSLSKGQRCPVFAHLAEIAAIVERTQCKSISPYMDKVRCGICARCLEDAQGNCVMRDALDCALDTYLPMIVDEIEFELELQDRDQKTHLRTFA